MKIKRSKFAIFLNTGTAGSPAYNLIGNGVTDQTVNYNPQTTDETYIHQDSGTTDIETYKPTIPTPMTAYSDDPVFAYIDALRKNRAVLGDARSDVVFVYLYETPAGSVYPAEKTTCSIQIDDFGGPGGQSVAINFTINLIGDPTEGSFDPTSKAFTASTNPTRLVTFAVTGTDSARVSGAQILVNGVVITTNANGFANIQLAAGSYTYVVTAPDYDVETDSITVSTNPVLETVSLTASD